MVARNISRSLSHVPLDGTPSAHWVAQQIEIYFATHPETSWESFLLSALQRELAIRNRSEESHNRPLARTLLGEPSDPTASQASVTKSDMRLHALLAARV